MSTFDHNDSFGSCGPHSRKKAPYAKEQFQQAQGNSLNSQALNRKEPETITSPFQPAQALNVEPTTIAANANLNDSKVVPQQLSSAKPTEESTASSHLCTKCGNDTIANAEYVSLFESTTASAKADDLFGQIYASGLPPNSVAQKLITK